MHLLSSPRRRGARPALIAACLVPLLALAVPAVAQSGPPIPKMPMPPSASDPAPVDSKAKLAPKKRQIKAVTPGEESGKPAPKPRRSSAATPSSGQTYDRPSRYVPDEFDGGRGDDGSRAKPFVTDSGRAGMGMKF